MNDAVDEPRDVPLTGLVWRLSMRWRSAVDREIAPLGLTHAQYAVLVPLSGLERDGRRPTQRELADLTGLEPLYVSKLARALEQAGLVERTAHPDDTRAVQLTLTDAGRDVAARAIELVVALQDDLLAPLTPARTAQLRSALLTLLDSPRRTP